MTYEQLKAVYEGSDGAATRSLYQLLDKRGPIGVIGMNLFRAAKCSARAKDYRGGNHMGSFRSQAYDRKEWSIAQLCAALRDNAGPLGITWGWGVDRKMGNDNPHRHVLYIDIVSGQVSFHCARDGMAGLDYLKSWDGVREQQAPRIITFIATIFGDPEAEWHAARLRAKLPGPDVPAEPVQEPLL